MNNDSIFRHPLYAVPHVVLVFICKTAAFVAEAAETAVNWIDKRALR